jgi:hypothetical protein
MKIFHSDLTTDVVLKYKQLHPDKPLRALISYGKLGIHHSNLMLSHRSFIDGLIMDSGTFTLNQNLKKYRDSITFEGYRSYLGQFAKKMDFYFNFDEDFSKNGFTKNFGYQIDLENAGFSPVPVVHDCYGPEIQTYIDRGHKLIAIGSGELKHAGLDELYRIVNGIYQKGVKVHFLGCTEYKKLAYTPVYSADSTTWNRTGSSGRIFYWNPNRMGYNKLDKIAVDDKPPKRLTRYHIRDYLFRNQLEDYLCHELGLSINDLLGRNRLLNRALVNIHYFVLLEELINSKHKEQGFSFK